MLHRPTNLRRIVEHREQFDVLIIGGGATGVGVAVDAASRGYTVALLEQADFGKGTSSRSTKLVHGGVRYLQQGNLSLVTEALKERGILKRNAPHLVHDLAFVVPNYAWWEAPFYGIGMKVYDLLAFRYGFGRSRLLSKEETLERIPTLETDGLRGGVLYYDGQFDDARLLINLSTTAESRGAALINYARVVTLTHDDGGFVNGVEFIDDETGERHTVNARSVINATGAFSDAVRKIDDPTATPMLMPSQGVHLVLDRSFLPGNTAIMVPKTRDGRVMFAIPWRDHVLLGTTDTPVKAATLEPLPTEDEIDFILNTTAQYLARNPTRNDVLSVFTGIRPLVSNDKTDNTAAVSRGHSIHISKSGLLTIAGGKWTTYRKMAEECVDHAATLGKLEERECVTRTLRVHGYHEHAESFSALRYYGSDAVAISSLAQSDARLAETLHPALPITAAEIVFATREEMARTVDDALARRTRALPLNARAAIDIAPQVAKLMAAELGRDHAWEIEQVQRFNAIAAHHIVPAGARV